MKNTIYLSVIILLLLFISIHFYFDTIETNELKDKSYFIWNDDEESIPMDGTLIRIEFTDENNIYIGPISPQEEKNYLDLYFIEPINNIHND